MPTIERHVRKPMLVGTQEELSADLISPHGPCGAMAIATKPVGFETLFPFVRRLENPLRNGAKSLDARLSKRKLWSYGHLPQSSQPQDEVEVIRPNADSESWSEWSAPAFQFGGVDFMPFTSGRVGPVWRVMVVMLAVIFVAESTIMLSLPKFLPSDVDWVSESLLDALLLTLTVAPIFWLLLVRPVRRLAEFRTEMLARTISAQENERRRIARDLHDEVGQSLTSLLVGLRNVSDADSLEAARSRVEPLRDVASTVLDDIKRLARGLRPSVLDDLGLAPALERLVQDFGRTHGLDVSLEINGLTGSRLPEQHEVTVYRIVQESLTNIAKHAQATTVNVAIERLGDELKIAIQDDGRGFVVASAKQMISEGHLGLTGMRERAALLGGWLTIQSQPGQGTQTVSGLPLPKGND